MADLERLISIIAMSFVWLLFFYYGLILKQFRELKDEIRKLREEIEE